MYGFLVGYLTRKGYDRFNRKKMVEKYEQKGEMPKRKSMFLSLISALLLGSFGLIYIAPRTAIPFIFLEIILLLFTIGVFNLVFRPIALFVAWIATLSYNNMIIHLFGEIERPRSFTVK